MMISEISPEKASTSLYRIPIQIVPSLLICKFDALDPPSIPSILTLPPVEDPLKLKRCVFDPAKSPLSPKSKFVPEKGVYRNPALPFT